MLGLPPLRHTPTLPLDPQRSVVLRAVRARGHRRAHPRQDRRLEKEGDVDGRRAGARLSGSGPQACGSGTGNFLRPYRELNRAIREIFALIRESRSRPLFGHLPGRQSDRPDRSRTLPRRRTGTPPDARNRRSRSRAPALSMKAPQACRANRSPSSSPRTIGRSGLPDGGVGRVARARAHRRDGGPRVGAA